VKGAGAAIKVGLLVVGALVLGYFSWKTVGERAAGKNAKRYFGMFKDASGLYNKSRVVIAGLTVGEVGSRTLDGNRARVYVRVQRKIRLWENAIIYKKTSSLIGEFYLEIDPGAPEEIVDGQRRTVAELADGGEIKHVEEATTADQIMRNVNTTLQRTMPLVNETLVEIRDLAKQVKELSQGPVKNIATNLDKAVAEQVGKIGEALDRTNAILANVQSITSRSKDDLVATIANAREASEGLKELLSTGKGEVSSTGAKVREAIDKLVASTAALEKTLNNTASITEKIDKPVGTVGKLINDPQIAEDLGQIGEETSGFVRRLAGLQTVVGLTSEYNVLARSLKTYLSLQLIPAADKYYLLEFIDDPRGARQHMLIATRSTDPDEPPTKIEERVTVASKFRFTFMFAKRIDWLTLRFGIKESTGGIGADFALLDKRLEIRTDLFDAQANIFPRFKVEAALNFFQYLYLVGGVDDILNAELGSPAGGGRDYFFGAQLRFNDDDLKTLLAVGGGALGAAGGN